MEHGVYSVYDKTAREYGPVFQSVNDGVARRAVLHLLSKVPAYDRDAYQLCKVGSFDTERGVMKVDFENIDIDIPDFDEVQPRKFGFVDEEGRELENGAR